MKRWVVITRGYVNYDSTRPVASICHMRLRQKWY